MKQSNTNAPPIMVTNRPIGIAFLTIVLLAIGWVVGQRMAIKAPTQALRSKIEHEFERKFDQDLSAVKINMGVRGNVGQTSELIRKIRAEPGDLKEICDEQLFNNIYWLSYLQTSDRFEDTSIGYELWMSIDLLGISSLEEFQNRFKSSKVYDSCRDYFVERVDGQEHYSNLLKLVNQALSDTDKYRDLNALMIKRVNTLGKSGE